MSRFAAVCPCLKHEEWFHGEVAKEDLCLASRDEVLTCSTDERHKGKKRKVCKACRSRIEVELKLQKLENQTIVSEPEVSLIIMRRYSGKSDPQGYFFGGRGRSCTNSLRLFKTCENL